MTDPATVLQEWLAAHAGGDLVLARSLMSSSATIRVDEREMHGFDEWMSLRPPPPHVIRLLVAAAQSRQVADALVEGFNNPTEQWSRFSSPEGAEAFLARFGMVDS